MKLLAIDTSANLCAACVWDKAAERELGRSVEDLGTGHAEHLMAIIGQALEVAQTDYSRLGALAVSTGPGSFTGVRVGVATARGLALALKIPASGIMSLDAIAAEMATRFPGRPVMVALDAGRGDCYVASYDAAGACIHAPSVAGFDETAGLARRSGALLAGTAAARIVEALAPFEIEAGGTAATADIAVYARLAAGNDSTGEKPRPAYLRGPDAKPQAGFILPRAAS